MQSNLSVSILTVAEESYEDKLIVSHITKLKGNKINERQQVWHDSITFRQDSLNMQHSNVTHLFRGKS